MKGKENLFWRNEDNRNRDLSTDVTELKQGIDYLTDHVHIVTHEIKKLKKQMVDDFKELNERMKDVKDGIHDLYEGK
jgi:hypothetical protein